MKYIYLLLAICGAVLPYVFFIDFIQQSGIDLPLFVQSLFVNGAAGGFSADLLLSSCVFWIFMFNQRPHGPHPALYIVLNLSIGLSCALPAYLYAKACQQEVALA